MRTWLGPGAGISRATTSNGARGRLICTAVICAMRGPPLCESRNGDRLRFEKNEVNSHEEGRPYCKNHQPPRLAPRSVNARPDSNFTRPLQTLTAILTHRTPWHPDKAQHA